MEAQQIRVVGCGGSEPRGRSRPPRARTAEARPIANSAKPGAAAHPPDEPGPGPDDWLGRARAGDAEAFGALVRHYEPDVARLCRRLLGSADEAQDAAQESFLRAHAALEGYDPARPFRPWLLAIAAHRAIDALRRRSRDARLFAADPADAEALPGPGPSPLEHGLSAELRGRLLRAIEAQPDPYRAALVLRYYADLEYDVIAGILGVSRNQVATLLFRGRRRLRAALAARDGS